jgi:oligo-1,6-glucosidase
VGEMPAATVEHAVGITHGETGALNMLFQFEHMDLDIALDGLSKWDHAPLSLYSLKRSMTSWQKGLEGAGWNSLYLSNHDQPRPVSRFGDDAQYRVESAKMLATFLHMLQGTPYVYQGEEIGMTNVPFDSIEDYRDIETLNAYRELVEHRGLTSQAAMAMIRTKSRDNARTPMQWDDGPNAGFTTGTPWIKVNPNYPEVNVARAMADPDSVFHYYRRLIQLRKANPVIIYGAYDLILLDHPQIYAFTRTLGDERLLVVLNFSREAPVFSLPEELVFRRAELLVANYPVDAAAPIAEIALRPYEARVYRLG